LQSKKEFWILKNLKMKKKEQIFGLHACFSALNNHKRDIIKWECTQDIFNKIKDKIIPINLQKNIIVDRKKLDKDLRNKFHQGIQVLSNRLQYEDSITCINNYNSTILILDSLKDSQNVGAIIRSAYLFGISLIIYNEKNSFDITPILIKSASGAYEKVKLCKVVNIIQVIQILKKKKYWVVGLDHKSLNNVSDIQKNIKKAIVIGSESKGIRSLIKKNCDYLINIPMKNSDQYIDSLNVSNAASIVFYELSK